MFYNSQISDSLSKENVGRKVNSLRLLSNFDFLLFDVITNAPVACCVSRINVINDKSKATFIYPSLTRNSSYTQYPSPLLNQCRQGRDYRNKVYV